MAALLAALTLLCLGLGAWQIERRAWKLDLIEAVEARRRAPPAPAPGPEEWSRVTAVRDAYRRVRVAGQFDHTRATRVQATTVLGQGAWLLTPLLTGDGWTVLVNRGFVPAGPATVSAPAGPVAVTGLLRISEPKGGFLRANDPARDRWYSRDVAAIARARSLGRVAPYFIDADASGEPGPPVGGLTVVAFRNTHLVYALTWFALAGLGAWGLWRVVRER
jgi:surfeit locus 1 family protein